MRGAIDLPLSEARANTQKERKQPHYLIFPPFGGIKGRAVKLFFGFLISLIIFAFLSKIQI